MKARVEEDTDELIKLPLSFNLVWKEPFNRLKAGVGFWMPFCPPGFVALGGVMTLAEEYPDFGTCYCISAEHAERASGQNTKFEYQIADHQWHNPYNHMYFRDFTDSIKIVNANDNNQPHLRQD